MDSVHLWVGLWVCLSVCLTVRSQFLDTFAVVFYGNRSELEETAASLGFEFYHELKYSEIFLLRHSEVPHRSKRSADKHVDILRSHPKVMYAHQEEVLSREKRYIIHDKQMEMPLREIKDNSIFHRVSEARLSARTKTHGNLAGIFDPLFPDQWYLDNTGQSGGTPGVDLNVQVAWSKGFTGAGVVIVILDDGIYHNHTDLIDNYDSSASTDLNDLKDVDSDPMPDMSTAEKESQNRHGTWCAGEIAAGANHACGVGVAYHCKIGGIRLLDGDVTDAMEAEALNFNNQHIDIYSSSWGPPDNGRSMDRPRNRAAAALRKGVRKGRNGKGSIFVWATGNGGQYGDNCGADGYVSSIETMSFGSVTDKGTKPYFMEQCTSTLAVVPSGGEEVMGEEAAQDIVKLKVVTTDLNDGCIENFQGTSSAAPLAAACCALALQANSELTWRDVQHIVVHSSRIPSVDHTWIINGAGIHVSHTFGFGVLDCGRMVELAQVWKNVPEQHMCINQRKAVKKYIPSKSWIKDELIVSGCRGLANAINNLEHVKVHVKIEHSRRGDVQLFLVSPSNTWSQILAPRPLDDDDKGIDFEFMTVHSWSENPEGRWTLFVLDRPSKPNRVNTGQLLEWTLTLYGTAGSRVNRMETKSKSTGEAHFPNLVEVHRLMKDEEKRTENTHITPLGQPTDSDLHSDLTARLLNELISDYEGVPDGADYTPHSQDKDPVSRQVIVQDKKSINSYSRHRTPEDRAVNDLVTALLREVKIEDEAKEEEKTRKEEKERIIEKQKLDYLMERLLGETSSRGGEQERRKQRQRGNAMPVLDKEGGVDAASEDLSIRTLSDLIKSLQEEN